MDANKLILWGMLIIPWFSLLIMNKDTIKRFTPVAILSALLVTVTHEAAYSLGWWEQLNTIVPWGEITNVSYVYGMFAVGTYWIFYFSYGTFWRYFLLNTVVDGVWLIFIPPFFKQRHIWVLDRMNEWSLLVICLIIAVILYGYQYWQEQIYKEGLDRDEFSFLRKVRQVLGGKKEPAR
jgi:type IV secretory pathway VirB2 component (pilin)